MRWFQMMLLVLACTLVAGGLAWAEEAVTPDADKATPAEEQGAQTEPSGTPEHLSSAGNGQVLTAEEMETLRASADSLAGTQQVQNMEVGAGINGTIVLSVLAALIIFAVLISVL